MIFFISLPNSLSLSRAASFGECDKSQRTKLTDYFGYFFSSVFYLWRAREREREKNAFDVLWTYKISWCG